MAATERDFWDCYWYYRKTGIASKAAYAQAIVDCEMQPAYKPSKAAKPVIQPYREAAESKEERIDRVLHQAREQSRLASPQSENPAL